MILCMGVDDNVVLATFSTPFMAVDAHTLTMAHHPVDGSASIIWRPFAPSRFELFIWLCYRVIASRVLACFIILVLYPLQVVSSVGRRRPSSTYSSGAIMPMPSGPAVVLPGGMSHAPIVEALCTPVSMAWFPARPCLCCTTAMVVLWGIWKTCNAKVISDDHHLIVTMAPNIAVYVLLWWCDDSDQSASPS